MTDFMQEVCRQLDKIGVQYKYVPASGEYYECVYFLNEMIGFAFPNDPEDPDEKPRFFKWYYKNYNDYTKFDSEAGHIPAPNYFGPEDIRKVKDDKILLFILQNLDCCQE